MKSFGGFISCIGVLACLSSSSAFAQETSNVQVTLTGEVRDSYFNKPVPNAKIEVVTLRALNEAL